VHALPERSTINPETHSGLLEAIAKARLWIDDLVKGRAQSLAEIAHREGKVERHIRLLAPLAFVSPPVILAVLDGVAPPFKLNVTSVAAAASSRTPCAMRCLLVVLSLVCIAILLGAPEPIGTIVGSIPHEHCASFGLNDAGT